MSNGQAKAGGEIGVNGYFYKGGQFLPSTQAEPGKWKVAGKWISSKKEQVAPCVWAQQPTPFSRSIFMLIGAWCVVKDGALVLRENIRDCAGQALTAQTEIRPGVKGVLTKESIELGALIDAYNAGQRWFDVQPDAVTIAT